MPSNLSGLSLSLIALLSVNGFAKDKPKARPVPKTVNVGSSQSRVDLWKDLSPGERALATQLVRATRAARALTFSQSHRHAWTIEKVLSVALGPKNVAQTKAILGSGYGELVNYASIFDDQHGPYGTANRKMLLQDSRSPQIEKLLLTYAPDLAETKRQEISRLLTDPDYEVLHHPEAADGEGLEACGTNMYEKGITAAELNQALKGGLKIGLNARVVRGRDGELRSQPQSLNEPDLEPQVRAALVRMIAELEKALPLTLTKHQKAQIGYLIKFLQEGNEDDFRRLNIEWVRDASSSRIDFVSGWTETYMDHLTQIGTWESYVQILDPRMTREAVKLAALAQYFEDKMPYGKFKKTFPADYSPPALLSHWFQEVGVGHYSGFNLPNYDDIRRDVGAKNVIRIRSAAEKATTFHTSLRPANLKEFSPDRVRAFVVEGFFNARAVIVLLHEIIGHGSGTYDETKYPPGADPTRELGVFGGALEEQRSDLTALVYIDDPKLVEIGLYKSPAEAEKTKKAAYDGYLAEFLSSVAHDRNFNESHLRGHLVFIHDLLEAGAIAMESKNGSPTWTPEDVVLAVKDYGLYQKVAHRLLGELQDIKANRKEAELKTMFETRASLERINESWAQGVIRRGERIGIDGVQVDQPWSIADENIRLAKGASAEETIAERLRQCMDAMGLVP